MNVVDLIKKYKKEIFDELIRDEKSFNDYKFISNEFTKGNIIDNNKFQKIYRRFYVLNGAGLGEKIIDRYFELLQKRENNLKNILTELAKIPRLNGKPAILLSFASKLIHTVDNSQPIYDSRVAKIFNLKLNYNMQDIHTKINDRLLVYNLLRKRFHETITDQKIKEIIKEFKKRLGVKISDVKMLDFILWKLGSLLIKNRKID